MMRRYGVLAAAVLCLCAPARAQEANQDGWEQVVKKKDLRIEMRKHAGSDICDVRSTGTIDAPVAAVEALLRDVSGMKEYGFRVDTVERVNVPELGLVSAKDQYYVYLKVDCPWPVVDRDLVVKFTYRFDPASGAVYIESNEVDAPYKLSQDCVRSPLSRGKYTLIPKGANTTYCVIEATGDPGGALPPAVINLFARFGSQWTFGRMRNLAASGKYNKPGISITTTTLASQ